MLDQCANRAFHFCKLSGPHGNEQQFPFCRECAGRHQAGPPDCYSFDRTIASRPELLPAEKRNRHEGGFSFYVLTLCSVVFCWLVIISVVRQLLTLIDGTHGCQTGLGTSRSACAHQAHLMRAAGIGIGQVYLSPPCSNGGGRKLNLNRTARTWS